VNSELDYHEDVQEPEVQLDDEDMDDLLIDCFMLVQGVLEDSIDLSLARNLLPRLAEVISWTRLH
jgi:hypothetical protein